MILQELAVSMFLDIKIIIFGSKEEIPTPPLRFEEQYWTIRCVIVILDHPFPHYQRSPCSAYSLALAHVKLIMQNDTGHCFLLWYNFFNVLILNSSLIWYILLTFGTLLSTSS